MAKPDTNFLSFADRRDENHDGLNVDPRAEGKDPADFDDLLKISHCRGLVFSNFVVQGAGRQRENAIDLNRECSGILLIDGTVEAGQQNAITIKGGCTGTTLRRLVILRPSKKCDIELGNHSDQSAQRTTHTYAHDVTRSDGQRVRVTVGHADWPIATGDTQIERQYFRSYRLKAYLALKRIFPALP
jgi:hypothetical protein